MFNPFITSPFKKMRSFGTITYFRLFRDER
jgi:hypothetical protein